MLTCMSACELCSLVWAGLGRKESQGAVHSSALVQAVCPVLGSPSQNLSFLTIGEFLRWNDNLIFLEETAYLTVVQAGEDVLCKALLHPHVKTIGKKKNIGSFGMQWEVRF